MTNRLDRGVPQSSTETHELRVVMTLELTQVNPAHDFWFSPEHLVSVSLPRRWQGIDHYKRLVRQMPDKRMFRKIANGAIFLPGTPDERLGVIHLADPFTRQIGYASIEEETHGSAPVYAFRPQGIIPTGDERIIIPEPARKRFAHVHSDLDAGRLLSLLRKPTLASVAQVRKLLTQPLYSIDLAADHNRFFMVSGFKRINERVWLQLS